MTERGSNVFVWVSLVVAVVVVVVVVCKDTEERDDAIPSLLEIFLSRGKDSKDDEPALIFKGNPEKSILVWRLEASHGTTLMPPKKALDDRQINLIKAWIAQGAVHGNAKSDAKVLAAGTVRVLPRTRAPMVYVNMVGGQDE